MVYLCGNIVKNLAPEGSFVNSVLVKNRNW